jgi:hypothetical protein
MPRPKGSSNKISMTLKTRLNLFLERNFDAIQNDYDTLDAKDKLSFFKDILPYIMPKMQAITSEVELKQKLHGLSDEQLDQIILEVSKRTPNA